MRELLAFDIAFQTGWACSNQKPDGVDGPDLDFGHFSLDGIAGDGEEFIGARLHHFRLKLEIIMVAHPFIRCVAWEKPIQASRHSAVYDEFVKGAIGVLRIVAFERNWTALPCDMKAVRRHFIGAGTPRDAKQQVWMRCQALGYRCKNTDESDAIATWDYALGVMKAREIAQSKRSFGGSGGGKVAASGRARSHRPL